jgi:coproporphyrinogen III oxidase-like Fe-S oxidoreductase
LAELSIELNPYPEEEILNFVKSLNNKYPKISRLRYSFGLQSFDDEILRIVGRAYSFASVVEFLRSLSKLKQDNTVFNFDFIAFGKFQVSKNGYKQLWHEFKRDFLQKFLASGYVDSVSLYTLENIKDKPCPVLYYGSDEDIMEEFLFLKDMIEDE